MSSEIILSDTVEHKIVCFEPDLTLFKEEMKGLYDSLVLHYFTSAWDAFVEWEQFELFAIKCMRVYSHLSFNHLFVTNGFATDSTSKIISTIGTLCLPVYMLDAIREICRPMYTDAGYSILPYFPANDEGLGPCYGLGWNNTEVFISSSLSRKIGDLATIMVQENPGKCPIFISSNLHFGYANGSTCPTFRMESMNRLKFLKPFPRFYLGFRTFNRSRPGVSEVPVTMRMQDYNPTARSVPDWSEMVKDSFVEQDTFFDAEGNPFVIPYEFRDIRSFAHLCHADAVRPAPQIGARAPVPRFGLVTKDDFVKLLMRFSINDAILSDPLKFRAEFSFGTGFRFNAELFATTQFRHFPTPENPSKESLPLSTRVGAGKESKGSKVKKKHKESLPDSKVDET